MRILKSKEERKKNKLNNMLSKESIEQLTHRLVTINKQFIAKIDELENIRHNLVDKPLFLETQQQANSRLLDLEKSINEELTNKIDTTYKSLFSKYQEYIDEKNQEILVSHKNYSKKMVELDSKFVDYEEIKKQFTELFNDFVSLKTENEKMKLLEESYKDVAIQLIEDKIQSEKLINEVADRGSRLILEALNNELSAFSIREQKTFTDAIKNVFETSQIMAKEKHDDTDREAVKLRENEFFHKTYEKVKSTVLAGVIPMVVGPAGSGKSHAMQQIARDLKLNFYMANRIQNTFELVGFVDAAGKYVTTQFYEAFTKGGLFFFDEVDASSPEALVTINAAVAQGHMAFPGHSQNVTMHDDFKAVVAGNTYGTGSTLQYTGRNKLDAATLDRFMVIEWDYDQDLEKQTVKDEHLLEICWTLREIVKKLQADFVISHKNRDNNPYDSIIISTRGIENLERIFEQEQRASTMTKEELFKSKFFASAKTDILKHILSNFKTVDHISKNKYYKHIEVVLTS